MYGDEEHAMVISRAGSTFPADWGVPEGRRQSPERASWVKRHVEVEMRSAPHRRLARAAARYLAIARSAELAARQ